MGHHHHEASDGLTFTEKLTKILSHWVRHNAGHAETYRSWAERAKEQDLAGAGEMLDEVSDLTLQVNEKLEAVRRWLEDRTGM